MILEPKNHWIIIQNPETGRSFFWTSLTSCSTRYYQARTFNAEAATATGRKIEWKFCAEDAVALLEKDCDFDAWCEKAGGALRYLGIND